MMITMRKFCKNLKRNLNPARTTRTRSQCLTSTCYFHGLPTEVLYMIVDNLSELELSVFSMASKEINRCIMEYVSSATWREKIITQNHSNCLDQESGDRQSRHLGLLFKRCSLLLPTKDKLKFIFGQLSQIPCFRLEQCLVPDCSGLASCGVLLQTLTVQWDELQCHRVFNFLWEHTNLLQKLKTVLTAKPGVKWYQELQLRRFCRQILLDPWLHEPKSHFWLKQLLRPWPMVSQARLLIILYGPLTPEGVLGWQDLVETELPQGPLWDLARAFLLLYGKRDAKDWTTNSMLVILEELIVVPRSWHPENVAHLLTLCGNNLSFTVLASNVLNGRLAEASRLIFHIILVHERQRYDMKAAVKLVLQICKFFNTSTEQFIFIRQLENMFSVITTEFFEVSLAGNHLENQRARQSLHVLLEASTHFHTKLISHFVM